MGPIHLSCPWWRLVEGRSSSCIELWYRMCREKGYLPWCPDWSSDSNCEYGHLSRYSCIHLKRSRNERSHCFTGEAKPSIRNVFTLNSCAHIVGSQVLSFNDELALLESWRDFVEKVDPDVVIGYNISNFDFPYLLDRANALKSKKFHYLGRIKSDVLIFLIADPTYRRCTQT